MFTKEANSLLQAGGLPASSVPSFVAAFMAKNQVALRAVTGVTPAIIASATTAAQYAYVPCFQHVWEFVIAIMVLALVSTFFMKSAKTVMNDRVDAPLKNVGHSLLIREYKTNSSRLRSKKSTSNLPMKSYWQRPNWSAATCYIYTYLVTMDITPTT